jgi:outer membrane protein insertion porin family/translocation and assembly module TamA
VPTGVKCTATNVGTPGCSRPKGGETLWEASFEVRFPVSGALSMVAFADTSDVTRKVGQLRFNEPHLSVGPGIRYDTPVGPLRLDIGYRVPGLQAIGKRTLPKDEGVTDPLFGIPGLDLAIQLAFGEAF